MSRRANTEPCEEFCSTFFCNKIAVNFSKITYICLLCNTNVNAVQTGPCIKITFSYSIQAANLIFVFSYRILYIWWLASVKLEFNHTSKFINTCLIYKAGKKK